MSIDPWAYLTSWPVKYQGPRPTCSAFGLVACREHRAYRVSGLRDDRLPGLSEQYLHWGAKGFEPAPPDGASLKAVGMALREHGVCPTRLWPYQHGPFPGQDPFTHAGRDPVDPSQVNPSAAAHLEAVPFRHHVESLRHPTVSDIRAALAEAGVAALSLDVLALIKRDGHRAVCSFPNSRGEPQLATNWLNDFTRTDGKVLGGHYQRGFRFVPAFVESSREPLAHAVCVVAYLVPEVKGEPGWFVVRNSHGQLWGMSPAVPGQLAILPRGYGFVSEQYVRDCAQELAYLRAEPFI